METHIIKDYTPRITAIEIVIKEILTRAKILQHGQISYPKLTIFIISFIIRYKISKIYFESPTHSCIFVAIQC